MGAELQNKGGLERWGEIRENISLRPAGCSVSELRETRGTWGFFFNSGIKNADTYGDIREAVEKGQGRRVG